MRYVYIVLMLISVIFADNVSQAIEDAKQAEKLFMQGLKTNDKEIIKHAYKLAEQAQINDTSNLRIKQLYYGIGVARISLFKEKNIVDEIKNVFPNLLMANVNVAPPSYLDGLLFDQNNTKEKLKLLKKALIENRRFPETYLMLAENYLDLNRYDLAIDILKRGLKNTELEVMKFHYYLVNAYMFKSYFLEDKLECGASNKNLTKQIIQEGKKVLKLNPKIYEMYLNLAHAYERLGQRILALDAIERYVKNSDSEDLQVIYEEFLLNNGKKNKFFKRLHNHQNSKSLVNRANAYFYNQEWGKAANFYKQYIDKEAVNRFYGYFSYANALKANNKEKEAYAVLKNLPSNVELKPWHKLLISLFLNNISDKKLIEAAKNKCKKTEAYFWIGMKNINTDKEKSKQFFQKVLDEKVYSYVEYVASKYYVDEGIK